MHLDHSQALVGCRNWEGGRTVVSVVLAVIRLMRPATNGVMELHGVEHVRSAEDGAGLGDAVGMVCASSFSLDDLCMRSLTPVLDSLPFKRRG